MHQRDTNDTAPIVGADLAGPANLAERYNETARLAMSDACRRNYRQRIAKIIKFWLENDPEYHSIGVVEVSEADLHDNTKYFFDGKYKQDLVYTGLNDQFLLHFLVSNKRKVDGKLKSVEDLRKYKDAVMWGAKEANELLPGSFYTMFDNYMKG